MEITRTSGLTGITRTLDLPVTEDQLIAWENGSLVQNAFPNLKADQREFLMTGIMPEEWAEVFGDEN